MSRGKGHRDNFTVDKQVLAVWHHVQSELCSIFATPLHLISNLSKDLTINFLHADKTRRTNWWDLPLIGCST
jgi:hypothetical protein